MTSAGAIGSLRTSAHPAARRTRSRTTGTETIATVANATTTKIEAHFSRRELMLGFISKFDSGHMEGKGIKPRSLILSSSHRTSPKWRSDQLCRHPNDQIEGNTPLDITALAE